VSDAHALPSMRVGVTELRRRPGNRRRLERSLRLGATATSAAQLDEPGEVRVELELESLSDGVVVTGVVTADWTGACRRCLEPATGTLHASVREVFRDHPEDDETPAVDHDAIDLGPVVHDAVVLALPLAPLCRRDCEGPDPGSFPVTVADETRDRGGDPRWAALDELRFDAD
jgi:uncharacterized protein